MNLSYEGIGQWAATFACGDVQEGQVVKISAGDTVAPCSAGDGFCGVVLSKARDGGACSVALGGMVTVSCTSAPAVGWAKLSADGSGGVKADEGGREYLVVRSESKTVTFVL